MTRAAAAPFRLMRPSSQRCRFWLVGLLALVMLAGLAGCSDDPQEASTQKVPWGKPASWEGGAPGMAASAPGY
jgi:hypothetical protein